METFLGISGMVIIFVNLYLLETGKLKAISNTYLFLGLFGSVFLTLYSWSLNSTLFVVMNFVFVLFNVYCLFRQNLHPARHHSR